MCLGIPMCVIEASEFEARCERGTEEHLIDIRLVGAVQVGDWVLTFLGAAREKIPAVDAMQINNALAALDAALNQTGPIDPFFADLVNREPELPEFLRPVQKGKLQ